MKNCVDFSAKIQYSTMCVKMLYLVHTILSTCACEIDEYLKSIFGDSVVTCDKVVDVVAKSYDEPARFSVKKVACKLENVYILLSFLLNNYNITIDDC